MPKHKDFPVSRIRELLEPGPVVLVTSAWKGERNIMTMGWHMVVEFTPSLIACIISNRNHSFDMIRKSKECVINIPTADMARTVIGIGNCSGEDGDKFAKFGLTAVAADKVKAPLIDECYAQLECRVVDARLVNKYNLFILEVVKAHSTVKRRHPHTLHYRGHGSFMLSGASLKLPSAK